MLFALFLATWLTVLLVLVGIVVVVALWRHFVPSERALNAQIEKLSTSLGADPVCPQCRTVYNRAVVIRLLKQVTPETFEFAVWTTKFKCKQCPGEVVISGRRGE